MKMTLNGWFPILGWMLLGAALVCFTALTPLPLLLHLPPFPGGEHMALASGSATLISAVVCLRMAAWHKRRTHVHSREEEPVTEQEQQAIQNIRCEEPLQRSSDLITSEEGEHLPLWLLQVVQAHSRAGRESAVQALLAEWHIPPSQRRTEASAPLACHVCGLPDLPSVLFICTRCQQLAHGSCSTLVRQAQEDGMTLAADPKIRPYCQSCLDTLLAHGWTLTRDDGGWLLIRRSVSQDEW